MRITPVCNIRCTSESHRSSGKIDWIAAVNTNCIFYCLPGVDESRQICTFSSRPAKIWLRFFVWFGRLPEIAWEVCLIVLENLVPQFQQGRYYSRNLTTPCTKRYDLYLVRRSNQFFWCFYQMRACKESGRQLYLSENKARSCTASKSMLTRYLNYSVARGNLLQSTMYSIFPESVEVKIQVIAIQVTVGRRLLLFRMLYLF